MSASLLDFLLPEDLSPNQQPDHAANQTDCGEGRNNPEIDKDCESLIHQLTRNVPSHTDVQAVDLNCRHRFSLKKQEEDAGVSIFRC